LEQGDGGGRRQEEPMSLEGRTRWFALLVLCLGDLMIVR
jgi:hypothetical protein